MRFRMHPRQRARSWSRYAHRGMRVLAQFIWHKSSFKTALAQPCACLTGGPLDQAIALRVVVRRYIERTQWRHDEDLGAGRVKLQIAHKLPRNAKRQRVHGLCNRVAMRLAQRPTKPNRKPNT